jgi:hypothetical protein
MSDSNEILSMLDRFESSKRGLHGTVVKPNTVADTIHQPTDNVSAPAPAATQNQAPKVEEPKANEAPASATLEKSDNNVNTSKDEEQTWAERYANLRSHSDKKEKTYIDRIKQLEEDLKTKDQKLPKTKEDLERFRKTSPELYDILLTIVKTEGLPADVKSKLDEVDAFNKKLSAEKQMQELEKVHPDARAIKNSKEFWDWFDKQTPRIQDMVNSEDSSVEEVATGIEKYKKDTGKVATNPVKSREERAAAASATNINNTSTGEPNLNQGKIWKASDVKKMSNKDFTKYEKEIDLAMKEGRFLYKQ